MSWFSCISLLVKPLQHIMVSLPPAELVCFSKAVFTLYQHGSKLHVVLYAYLLPLWERIEFALNKHLKCFYTVCSSQDIQRPKFQPSALGLFQNSHAVFFLLRKTAFLKLLPSTSTQHHLCKLAVKIHTHIDQWIMCFLFRITLFIISRRENNFLL